MRGVDTSALFFWTLDPARLTETAGRTIDSANRVIISSISIWEIALKVRRGALQIRIPVNAYVAELEKIASLEIIPVDTRTWLDSVALEWEHRDPADRVIVSLARQLRCPLVSSDRVIRAFYEDTLW